MLKQSKNISKNLPKTIFTQGIQKTLLSPDFQRQKEDPAACCLNILFFQTAQSFCTISLTWYCLLLVFSGISRGYIWHRSDEDFQ